MFEGRKSILTLLSCAIFIISGDLWAQRLSSKNANYFWGYFSFIFSTRVEKYHSNVSFLVPPPWYKNYSISGPDTEIVAVHVRFSPKRAFFPTAGVPMRE